MILDPLYHWSPSTKHDSILLQGLRPFQPTVVHSDPGLSYPYICLGPTPSMAWGLSGDMDWVSEIEEWDLWQIELPAKAEVHVRAFYGKIIEEVKVYTPIPADFLWYVGTREIPTAKEVIPVKE